MSNPTGNKCRVQIVALLACHTHCQKVAPLGQCWHVTHIVRKQHLDILNPAFNSIGISVFNQFQASQFQQEINARVKQFDRGIDGKVCDNIVKSPTQYRFLSLTLTLPCVFYWIGFSWYVYSKDNSNRERMHGSE